MVSAYAPGRIELLGNHTDYNEGYSLGFAVNMGVTAQGQARDDETVNLHIEGSGDENFSIKAITKNPRAPWADVCKGVLDQMVKAGAPLRGIDVTVTNPMPEDAALGANAATEVALVLFLQKAFGFEFGDMNDPTVRMGIASACKTAENDFLGTNVSIFDPAVSMMGKKDHVALLDFRNESAELLPLHPDLCFVLCHPGVRSMMLSSKFSARRSECAEAVKLLIMNKINVKALRDIKSEDVRLNAGLFVPRVFARAMHVTTENERTLMARDAILNNDIETLGKLMYESQESSREAFENSTPFLDQLVAIAKEQPSCVGARLTGGGFAGCTLSMVYRSEAEAFSAELTRQYREKSGKEPKAWIVEASEGAA